MTAINKNLKLAKVSPSPSAAAVGRVHSVSTKVLPRVDARAKERLEEAAKKPSARRRYPELG